MTAPAIIVLALAARVLAQEPARGEPPPWGEPPPAPPAGEPPPAPPPGAAAPPSGVTLQLHDPRGSLDDAPRVTVESIEGVLLPVDDGSAGDPRAGDGVYTASLPGWSGRDVVMTVTDGETTWTARGAHDGTPWLWVRIHDGRTMQVGNAGEGPGPSAEDGGAGPGGAPPAAVVGAATASWAEWAPSLVVWGAAALGFGVALAVGMVRLARASVAPARLIDGPPLTRVAPTLVTLGELPPVMAGLGARRWLAVGALPPDLARSVGRVATVAPGSAATEVLLALRWLAAREGPPVAVLVTDASTLDRRDSRPPLDELLAVLDGCVPCVCVVGAGYGSGGAGAAAADGPVSGVPSGTA